MCYDIVCYAMLCSALLQDGKISYAEFATAMQQIENDGVGVCW